MGQRGVTRVPAETLGKLLARDMLVYVSIQVLGKDSSCCGCAMYMYIVILAVILFHDTALTKRVCKR